MKSICFFEFISNIFIPLLLNIDISFEDIRNDIGSSISCKRSNLIIPFSSIMKIFLLVNKAR